MNEILVEANQQRDLLINNMKSVILSTVDKSSKPNASYAPSLFHNGSFYVYLSTLSKHSSNLMLNKKASLMIIEDESKAEKLFARKRITMDVDSTVVDRDIDEWNLIMDEMESKFGHSIKFLKDLTDFFLFSLKPQSGLLVYDFGRAFKLKGANLDEIKFLNEKGHKKG